MPQPEMTKSPNYKWFGLALQALVVLSGNADDSCPSHLIADSVKSEATLIRRILAQLASGGILETREGRVGGYKLRKAPADITLAEVYLALDAKDPCWGSMLDTVGTHPFGQDMKESFEQIIHQVNGSVLEVLKQHTVADLAVHCLPAPPDEKQD